MRNRITKRVLLFVISFFLTLLLTCMANSIIKYVIHQSMIKNASATVRNTDGASNLIVMNGIPGYIGNSSILLKYLDEGYIKLCGSNPENGKGWKKLCDGLFLEAGSYTFTGIKCGEDKTIALQLYINDQTGYHRYIYQWNEDVTFTLERKAEADLHVMVYPLVSDINILARPALYKDE